MVIKDLSKKTPSKKTTLSPRPFYYSFRTAMARRNPRALLAPTLPIGRGISSRFPHRLTLLAKGPSNPIASSIERWGRDAAYVPGHLAVKKTRFQRSSQEDASKKMTFSHWPKSSTFETAMARVGLTYRNGVESSATSWRRFPPQSCDIPHSIPVYGRVPRVTQARWAALRVQRR